MVLASVLDLSPIIEGGDAALAFRNTVDLAQHTEAWGYHRYWLAEHHNLPGIASAATSVVIGHVAGKTKSIRVGAGGIMLPNHAPLVIAEQFATLEALLDSRSIGEAAERLGVHRHTVVYRVGRLRQLGIDADDPEQRHQLWLALRCARLLED